MENIVSCPVCLESAFIPFIQCKDYSISKEVFNTVKCISCDFVFTNPRPDKNEIAAYYQSDIYISHHANKGGFIPWVYRMIRDKQFVDKTDIIKSHFSAPVSILDIGCGTGDFLNYCRNLGWETIGVEPDEDARKQVAEKNIQVYDLDYLNTTNNKYDVITMWHVLEHVHNLTERLNQLKNLLKENGIIIIAVPNHMSIDAKYYKEYWAAYDLPRHLSHFSQKTITNLFQRFSFNLHSIIPMKYDAYYVSIKSEEYKGRGILSQLFNGFIHGFISNNEAAKTKEYSSLIYVFKK
jgi:2-polyprenyl-3-methyl-5-hydroxy-6-metoxy-1,4-benzoquinol methylase